MKAISCQQLIDGSGDAPIDDAIVLLEDGIITEYGPSDSVRIPSEAERIQHSSQTIIPGLIDAHLHLGGWRSLNILDWIETDVTLGTARATADLKKILEAGFTSVRDLGSETGLGLKAAVAEGTIPGPRVFTSGPAISQTAGHGDAHLLPYNWVTGGESRVSIVPSKLADGADECRKVTRKLLRQGVDVIKIMTTGGIMSERDSPLQPHFTADEITAITEEAHRFDVQVASHAQSSVGITIALENGVDTIEHGNFMDKETAEYIASEDAILVPTFSVLEQLVNYGSDYNVPEKSMEKAQEAVEAHTESIQMAYELGVRIGLGTDFPGVELGPHGKNALEAELLVDKVGMTELETIRAATVTNGQTLPDKKVGGISEGNYADLTVLDEDPVMDISGLRSVTQVYKGGTAQL